MVLNFIVDEVELLGLFLALSLMALRMVGKLELRTNHEPELGLPDHSAA